MSLQILVKGFGMVLGGFEGVLEQLKVVLEGFRGSWNGLGMVLEGCEGVLEWLGGGLGGV
eukprot:3478264-Karenia_brevis.AAC.1